MTVANTAVKFFRSSDSGAPVVSGSAGTFIATLDACLVNGYGSVTLTSLVVAAGTPTRLATATVDGGHGFVMRGNTGPVVAVSGATPAGLNGNWRIHEVVSATEFTFYVPDTVDSGSATGTIVTKIAPLGWTKLYSGTDKAIYQPPTGIGILTNVLRVDDTAARQYAICTVYESATDIDTGVNLWGTYNFFKSSDTTATAREWNLAGDQSLFHWLVVTNANQQWHCFGQIDVSDINDADPYFGFIRGTLAIGYNDTTADDLGASIRALLQRSYTGNFASGGVSVGVYSHGYSTTTFGAGSHPYPSPASNKFFYSALDVWEGENGPRGMLPGIFNPLHTNMGSETYNKTFLIGGGDELNRDLFCWKLYSSDSRACLIDITGPWT